MLPHSRVELRRWFDSHKVGDCVAERGSGSTRDPLEALVTPLVIRLCIWSPVRHLAFPHLFFFFRRFLGGSPACVVSAAAAAAAAAKSVS